MLLHSMSKERLKIGYLLDVHDLLRNSAIKHSALDQVGSNFDTIHMVSADVASRIHQLAEVDEAVFDSNETNKVRPGRHREEICQWSGWVTLVE